MQPSEAVKRVGLTIAITYGIITAAIAFADDENADSDELISYQCYNFASPELGALIMNIKACDAEDQLLGHNPAPLKMIPAKGFKDGVAGVFKKFSLHVNKNAEIACNDHIQLPNVSGGGCLLTVYVSRRRANNSYSELAGWPAIWFRGVQEPEFRPMNKVAQYLSTADQEFLKKGGIVDIGDRP
jgi:hypothetical protein